MKRFSIFMDCRISIVNCLYEQSACQSNPEQNVQCWRYHNTWLQITLQNHSHKNRMLLTQKQTQTSEIEYNKYYRNKYKHLQPLIFNKGTKNICLRKDTLFYKWCWRNWMYICRKQIRPLSLIPIQELI
jgi:hypothetical protein